MSHENLLKAGLKYTLSTTSDNRPDVAVISNHAESITLTYHFSFINCHDQSSSNSSTLKHQLEFNFHHQYLKSFQHDIDIQQFNNWQQHNLCCNTQMILHDIINCKFEGAFRNMFLESKALALLLCFQKCNTVNESACVSCKFLTNKTDKEKILKAREIILSRLHNPPTIAELAIETGINQCYLKKGFKELFNTTVYDFVQEQRMSKARMLLSTSRLNVSLVADMIGFSSISNFSTAFKKHTGVFPSELQQN